MHLFAYDAASAQFQFVPNAPEQPPMETTHGLNSTALGVSVALFTVPGSSEVQLFSGVKRARTRRLRKLTSRWQARILATLAAWRKLASCSTGARATRWLLTSKQTTTSPRQALRCDYTHRSDLFTHTARLFGSARSVCVGWILSDPEWLESRDSWCADDRILRSRLMRALRAAVPLFAWFAFSLWFGWYKTRNAVSGPTITSRPLRLCFPR